MHVEYVKTSQYKMLNKVQLPDAEIVKNLIDARDALWAEVKYRPLTPSDPKVAQFFEYNRILHRQKPKTDAERIKELEDRVAELEKCT